MKFFIVMMLISSAVCADTAQLELEHQMLEFEEVLNQERNEGPIIYRELSSIRLRTILSFGINIPAITSLSLNPEVEFTYTK